jgi:hypothetical protein
MSAMSPATGARICLRLNRDSDAAGVVMFLAWLDKGGRSLSVYIEYSNPVEDCQYYHNLLGVRWTIVFFTVHHKGAKVCQDLLVYAAIVYGIMEDGKIALSY